MAAKNKGFGLLFEMGCGKTLTAIAIMGALYQEGKIDRVLIVAPTSVVAVWPHELADFAEYPFTVETLLGDKNKRLRSINDLTKYPYPKLKVAVINYESVWREDIKMRARGSRLTTQSSRRRCTNWEIRQDTR